MKRKSHLKNKKGFTMVELLATIVILGILATTSIIAVNKILEKSKNEYYKSLEKTVKLAGESYVQNNRKYLPKYIGAKTTVTLDELKKTNYIKEVKDYNKEECYGNKTYVNIFKYSKDKYSYTPYLNCPNYTNEETINNMSPEITITFNNDPSKTSIVFSGGPSGENIKLLSYRYIIYRNNKEILNTGDIEANYKEKITISNLDLSKYTPGTIKIKATATNIYGQTKIETQSKKYEDKNPPICIIEYEDKNIKSWTNSDRTITVGCDDGDGLGCKQDTYSKTFYTTTKEGTITIEDKAGNKTQCNVSVYVDKNPPTCTLKATPNGSNGWFTKDADITLSYSDSDSGINSYDLTTSSTASYNNKTSGIQKDETKSTTWYGYVKDKAGNVGKCTKKIRLDKTPPDVDITAYEQGTSKVIKAKEKNPATFDIGTSSKKIRIELEKSDSYSGVVDAVTLSNLEKLNTSNGHVYLSTEKTHDGTITVKDKAGNKRDIEVKATITFGPQLQIGDCNIRGNYQWNDCGTWWCEGGGTSHEDNTYYQHYCYIGNGKIQKSTKYDPKNGYDYVCPKAPYLGWTIIDDENRNKTWTYNSNDTWTGWKIIGRSS